MLTREQAFALVRQNISKKSVFYHVIAVEAIMKALARDFEENEEKWGLTGLLHDVDYEKTEAAPQLHSLLAEDILKGQVEPDMIKAIKTHNFEHTGVNPETKMEKALIAADAVSIDYNVAGVMADGDYLVGLMHPFSLDVVNSLIDVRAAAVELSGMDVND